MPRINQLPAASSVASTDVVAIDTQDKTYRVPKSTLFDGYYTAAEVDAAIAQSTAKTVDSGVLATYTYGTLRYRLLTNFGVAQIIWAGNANIPDETTVNVSLPDKLKPAINSYAVMRNGDMMEVRNETANGVLRLTFGTTPKAWSGASITYIP